MIFISSLIGKTFIFARQINKYLIPKWIHRLLILPRNRIMRFLTDCAAWRLSWLLSSIFLKHMQAAVHLTQIINHGYLAVDFFFMLSGFVIGYAYDDRWNRMTVGTFFKRRIIACILWWLWEALWRCLFLFSGVALFSTYREYVHRNNAAGDVAGLYLASSSAEVRHSRLDGNASVEWPGMVALLWIYRLIFLYVVVCTQVQ